MPKLWLLVEKEDNRKVSSSYRVISVDPGSCGKSGVRVGKTFLIRKKCESISQQVKILKVADNKRSLEEEKVLLERQDEKMQNMLTMCMRSIKKVQAEKTHNSSASSDPTHEVLIFDDSASDSDDSNDQSRQLNQDTNSSLKDTPQIRQYNLRNKRHLDLMSGRVLMSSTPLPYNLGSGLDKGTQTVSVPESLQSQLDELEAKVKNYAKKFSVYFGKDIKLIELNESVLSGEMAEESDAKSPADKDIEKNNVNEEDGKKKENENFEESDESEFEEFHELQESEESEEFIDFVESEESEAFIDFEESEESDDSMSEVETEHRRVKIQKPAVIATVATPKPKPKPLEVRRVSAQTTNNEIGKLVPIGNGNAKVPERVWNYINWNFYKTATRQLLQAVFTRGVLATHSLTGKPSPAFTNKPAKQCLDPVLVDDIVLTVTRRCNVTPREVRTIVTLKCADEARLERNRNRGRMENEENPVSAGGDFSDDSSMED